MKKSFTLCAAAALLVASVLPGCGDNSDDGADNPTVTGKFTITTPVLKFDGMTLAVECDNPTLTFYCAYNRKSAFIAAGNDVAYINRELAAMRKYAESEGVTLQELLSHTLHVENAEIDVDGKMDADMDYYVYAYGLSANGEVLAPMQKIQVRTPKADPVVMSDCTFDFDPQFIEATSFGIIVYPTDLTLGYFCGVIKQEDYYLYGGTSDGIKQYLQELFTAEAATRGVTYPQLVRDNLMPGIQALTELGGIEPETNLVAFAVGMDSQGRFNTEVGICEFATLPLEQSDASVTLKYSKYYDGTQLADADPSKYENARGKAYLPVTVTPNQTATHWSVAAGTKKSLGSQPDDILLLKLEQKGTADKTSMALGCDWAECLIIAAGNIEVEGTKIWGPIVKEEFTFVQANASPISDIISAAKPAYADASNLSSVLGFTQLEGAYRRNGFVPESEANRYFLVR